MSFQDRTLTCQDCGSSFTFSAEDQAFHAEKGYTNDPKRCPTCRDARRGGRSSNGFGHESRESFSVVCADCGKDTTVPFQPRGDRPVYCSDCYSKHRAPARTRR
jgi:CxxC-x17-CxxC domain-containing protein